MLGSALTVVSPAALPLLDLARYGSVVIGPSAYETQPDLVAFNPRLLGWVGDGGTLVVQYTVRDGAAGHHAVPDRVQAAGRAGDD